MFFFKGLARPEIRHGLPLPGDTPVPGFSVARRVLHEARPYSATSDLAQGDRATQFCCFSARVFLLFPSFLLLLPHIFSLYPAKLFLLLHLPTSLPTQISITFFQFSAQILYSLHICASPTFKLLQFAQFHSTHLSLSLSKTLTSIVEVEGC